MINVVCSWIIYLVWQLLLSYLLADLQHEQVNLLYSFVNYCLQTFECFQLHKDFSDSRKSTNARKKYKDCAGFFTSCIFIRVTSITNSCSWLRHKIDGLNITIEIIQVVILAPRFYIVIHAKTSHIDPYTRKKMKHHA